MTVETWPITRVLIQLGWIESPVHVATDLTPAEVKAYRLMDNRSHDEASGGHLILDAR